MKTPYDKLAKVYANCSSHMTKMATTTKYGKKPFKNLLLQNQKAAELETWYVAFGMLAIPILHK